MLIPPKITLNGYMVAVQWFVGKCGNLGRFGLKAC